MKRPLPRRHVLTAALGAAGATVALGATPAKTAGRDKSKVAYHLSDLDKVAFVLGNIQNHIDGVGGPDKVTIALVVHGPALKAFHSAGASPDVASRASAFSKAGVVLTACGNTMRAQKITLKDLLPGFIKADGGGVVRLAELQAEGYVYLRP
jgi:hypothetical protein